LPYASGSTARLRRAVSQFVATTGEEGVGDLRANTILAVAAATRDGRARGAGDERIIHRTRLASFSRCSSYAGPGGHSWEAFGVPNVRRRRPAASPHARAPANARTLRSAASAEAAVSSIPARLGRSICDRRPPVQLDEIGRSIHNVSQVAADRKNAKRAVKRALTVHVERVVSSCGERRWTIRSCVRPSRARV
jgi:hypothetical protein